MGFFKEVNKKFGFGLMRLPMNGDDVDYAQTSEMVDIFIENGFNYFDTAHGYINGLSEAAVKKCLSSRYPREKYLLTNKLSSPHFNSKEDIRPLLLSQLEACGVEYFDFYLMHAQDSGNYGKYKRCRAYETAFELKKEGLVKHVGMSFHDKAAVLDEILTDHPEIEAVQIQLNYVDYDDASVQSGLVYDVCVKHGKPVIVMEPVKGGNLVNLPSAALDIFEQLKGGSPASYAIRYAAGFENVFMVLSGMSNLEQMRDNVSFMRDFKPLDERERAAVETVRAVLKSADDIPCTSCRYCMEKCPKGIAIPELFACMNALHRHGGWNPYMYYERSAPEGKKASDCIKCGTCERVCPQHLKIRNLLENVAQTFEK
ncbi:MAG: aldo/keto reductase [Clostridia bacterium]|nr:aldo/keto reductase [Clostridia bacterium]